MRQYIDDINVNCVNKIAFEQYLAYYSIVNQIDRILYNNVKQFLVPGKVNIIYGARRVGKTSLMKKIATERDTSYLWLEGELPDTHDLLTQKNIATYENLMRNYDLVIIDEAQEIPGIGKILKIMVDQFPSKRFMVSGSSAFDLNNEMGEPLVGRAYWHEMYPLSQMELNAYENLLETKRNIDDRLIYGSYPELYTMTGYEAKQRYLTELTNAYLLKDILNYDGIRNATKIMNLLQLIAYQLGKEVSLQELGRQLGMSKNTVEKYLDLLEKVYVIKKISGFSRNLRKEVTKMSRYYFWDCGIRNAIINDYRPILSRQDKGELWENYLMTERLKKIQYTQDRSRTYFWRTYDQQEIDSIETKNDTISAYEFKYGLGSAKIPKAFERAYPDASYEVINESNYLEYIS